MITDCKIKVVHGEEILYIYINPVEFSLPWIQNFKNFSLKKIINSYNINFKGNKVILVLGSGILVTLLLTSNEFQSSNFDSNNSYVPSVLTMLNQEIEIDSNGLIENINNKNTSTSQIKPNEDKNNIYVKDDNTTTKNNTNSTTSNKQQTNNIASNNTSTSNSNKSTANNTTTDTSTSSNSNASSNKQSTPPSTSPSLPDNGQASNSSTENNSIKKVTVQRSNGTIITLNMTDYLIGVVGAEMPASFNEEALKAQAVLARTYVIKRMENNQVITDTTSTKVYKDNNQLKSMWGNDFTKYYEKIKRAVLDTTNEVCLYNNKLIDAVYHSTSNGKTEDSVNVWGNNIPYLVSVSSSYDTSASSYLRTVEFDSTKLLSLFGIDFSNLKIEIISRNQSGRVSQVMVNDKTYTGVEFRTLLGLRSSDFDVKYLENGIEITTRGFGHGVGMSQYGANGMAKAGYNYKQILMHYYQNITIEKR